MSSSLQERPQEVVVGDFSVQVLVVVRHQLVEFLLGEIDAVLAKRVAELKCGDHALG